MSVFDLVGCWDVELVASTVEQWEIVWVQLTAGVRVDYLVAYSTSTMVLWLVVGWDLWRDVYVSMGEMMGQNAVVGRVD